MTKLQFHILYRQFLFRMVDLELLSANAQGDTSKLLGQFGALLIFTGMLLSSAPLSSLIATTMLVVGLFAVLSWDSLFLDRRDVMVLAPLPIRARTLFLGKVAALATALGVTIVAFNLFPGLGYPLNTSGPYRDNIFKMIFSPVLWRAIVCYWITVFAAGVFIFCCVLIVQGVTSYLLPRRRFLRLSALMQMVAFCLFVSVYFLEPAFPTAQALADPRNQNILAWLPPYWFVGFYHLLDGNLPAELLPLALRAIAAIAIVFVAAAAAFVLSYFRSLRKIIEESDIVPSARGSHLPSRLGNPLVLFAIRTLLRSRQHRVILCFYLGVAFAATIALLKAPVLRQRVNVPMIVSSVIILALWILGTRIVFALPRDLSANWIFRIAPLRGVPQTLSASRRALFLLAAVPVLAGALITFLVAWPWTQALGHLYVLTLLALIITDLCVYNYRKIPFTCSFLPGKSQIHMAFWGFGLVLFTAIVKGAEWEQLALTNGHLYARLLVGLCAVYAIVRWRTSAEGAWAGPLTVFEERGNIEITTLDLHRDGIMPTDAPEAVTRLGNHYSASAQ